MVELELKPLLPLTPIRGQPFQFPPFVDKPYPQEILDPLTRYLRGCPAVVDHPGRHYDKVQGKVEISNPLTIHSDGVYYWRKDAASYLYYYPFRIDDEALEYFISRDWQWPDFDMFSAKAHKIAWALTNAHRHGDFPANGIVSLRYNLDEGPVQTPFTIEPLMPFATIPSIGFRPPVVSPWGYSREILDRLVPYLRNVPMIVPWMGGTRDLIADEEFPTGGGIAIMSDGKYYWRIEAADYLERHPIRISDEALSYFLSRNWEPPDFDTRSPRGLAIEKALTSRSALDLDTGIVTVLLDEDGGDGR